MMSLDQSCDNPFELNVKVKNFRRVPVPVLCLKEGNFKIVEEIIFVWKLNYNYKN